MYCNKMKINTISDSYHKQITICPLYRAVDLKDLSTYAMFNRAVAYIAGIKLQRAQTHEPKPTQHEYVLYYYMYFTCLLQCVCP